MVEMTVANTDVMISLPVPHYISRRFGRLYRMNYAPHITLASGTAMPRVIDVDVIRDFLREEVKPPRVALSGLTALPMKDGNNLLWANASLDPHFEYMIGTELPDWHRVLNGMAAVPGAFPYYEYGFRPHISLQYRKRPFRWLPKLPNFTWIQRWAEIVEGDTVVERIVIGKRSPEDSEG